MRDILSNIPVPYWIGHAALAVLIAVVLWPLLGITAGLAAGAFFYAGREFTQWEQGGGKGLPFDWPGLLSPLITCFLLYALLRGLA